MVVLIDCLTYIVILMLAAIAAPCIKRVFEVVLDAVLPDVPKYISKTKQREFTSPDKLSYPPLDRVALMRDGIIRPDPRYNRTR